MIIAPLEGPVPGCVTITSFSGQLWLVAYTDTGTFDSRLLVNKMLDEYQKFKIGGNEI